MSSREDGFSLNNLTIHCYRQRHMNNTIPECNNTHWWYMTTSHHSSCRSCVSLCWWHQPSSPEEKGSQQSHIPTLCSWHVAPSGNITLQTPTLEYTNTFLQRHCQKAVEAGTWSGDNFHSKLNYSCTGQQISGQLQKWRNAGDLYGKVMVRHLGSGEAKHHQRLRSSSQRVDSDLAR